MTVLTELARLYERLAAEGKAPSEGYSEENIGGEIVLDAQGNVKAIRRLGGPGEKGKWRPQRMNVPAPFKRTSGIKANRLWDKASYSLGLAALTDEAKKPLRDEQGKLQPAVEDRTRQEHEAFVELHEKLLAGTGDPASRALLGFVRTWRPDPERFLELAQTPEVLGENLVFRLDGEDSYIHERPAAQALIRGDTEKTERAICLVTGEQGPPARLHPAIKGVAGAQSSGASLVSFNLDAFTSYGKGQGENAPVSEHATFAYATALNWLLRDEGHHLRMGDTTVVFWAETPKREVARLAEVLMGQALNPPDDEAETQRLHATLMNIAQGRGLQPEEPAPDTRVFILGLAPNAARLAVRFWRPGTLGDFAANVLKFWENLSIEPPAWKGPPAAWSLLYETAAQRKAENIPPRMGGDLMRAVLTGADYPRTLISAVITRIRADHDVNGRRAAIIAAYLRRNLKEDFPVSLDRNNPDPAYRLGRLFAVLESIQQAALPGLNATIKDRYFAAAAATPARVFPLLVKNAQHHLGNLRKDKPGLAHWFESALGEIFAGLPSDLPRALNLEDQGRFIGGYYHQRWAKKDERTDTEPENELIEPEGAKE